MLNLLLVIFLIVKVNTIDNDLYAIIISTSHTFENYRHSTNSMMIYQYLKRMNIPDHKVSILIY
jgi:glycosylphosphatidylinositol transamidase (GPIT) subunit GPI8